MLTQVGLAKKDLNAMKTPANLSGEKTMGTILDLDLPAMKDYCKANKCTINDYCSSILSVSLYEYFEQEELKANQKGLTAYSIPKYIHMAVPFSLRQPFKRLRDVKLNNDFGSILIDLQPFKEFDDALPEIRKLYDKLKGSLMPFGVVMTTKISMAFPYLIPKLLMSDLTDKFSIVYSNLNASKSPYFFNEKQCIGHYFAAPGNGKLSTGVSLCTIANRMSLGVFSDKVHMADPQAFANIFARKNKEILSNYKKNM